MSNDDEIDFSQAMPTTASKTVEFFKEPIKAASLPGPESMEKLAETPLAYTTICEPMLKELYSYTQARKEAEGDEKELKDEVKALLGLERGMIQRGAYGVKATTTKGSTKTDWKRFLAMVLEWANNEMSSDGKKEINRILTQNTTTGEDGITLTSYRVGAEPKDE